MAQTSAIATLNLGFLTVLHESNGYLGGYLVTNQWGRPLEFRLSTAVQPNRVQQILYGSTLQNYVCADLIGKTLVDKTSAPVQVILTDRQPVLDLRLKLEVPVLWLPGGSAGIIEASSALEIRPATGSNGPILCHPRFPQDVPAVQELLTQLDGSLDVFEPFTRLRDAMGEARKLGSAARN